MSTFEWWAHPLKETQTQAEGRSPDLPPEHPLRHLDKSKENGEAWFNQSFDSDACLVMDDRSLFIHKAYVMEKSGFFERLFGDDMAGTSADYMLPLPKVLRYQYVMKIIQWMYTGDTQDHGITEQNCISMIREAKYFLMTDEFVMILCHVFVDAYKSEPAEGKEKLAMTLLDQASDTTLEELLTLLDDCGICKDLRLKILATWANKYSLSQSGDQQGLFRSQLSELLQTCTIQGLRQLRTQYPETFQYLPAAELYVINCDFRQKCQCCGRLFRTLEESRTRCTVYSHNLSYVSVTEGPLVP